MISGSRNKKQKNIEHKVGNKFMELLLYQLVGKLETLPIHFVMEQFGQKRNIYTNFQNISSAKPQQFHISGHIPGQENFLGHFKDIWNFQTSGHPAFWFIT